MTPLPPWPGRRTMGTPAGTSHVITEDDTIRAGDADPANTQLVESESRCPPCDASPGPARCSPPTDTTSAPHDSLGNTTLTLASGLMEN